MNEIKRLTDHVQSKGYRHIVCDLDGTITQLNLPWDKGLEMLYGRVPDLIRKDLQQGFRRGDPYGVVLNSAVERHEAFLPVLLAWSHDFEAQLISQKPYIDLVTALQSYVDEGRRVSIWTSNTRQAAHWALDQIGILSHCYAIVTRDDVRLLKPSSEGWRHIYDGGALHEYLFVGDSPNDELAAADIGIDYFAVENCSASTYTDK